MGLLLCFSVFYWSYSVVTLVYALGNARRRWITVSGDHSACRRDGHCDCDVGVVAFV